MNAFEKSEAIKASLRKGFRDGSSKCEAQMLRI